jgi:hypothetical protein
VLVSEIERLPLEGAELMEGLYSTHSTFFMGATNRATPSIFAGSSVCPGTSVNRTQTRLPIAASRSAKRKLGANSRPVRLR